ncbi:MAG: hypothetical protein HEQ23_07915 [Tepidisphaera sp.]
MSDLLTSLFDGWPVRPPRSIRWLLEMGILGVERDSKLWPWCAVEPPGWFLARKAWPYSCSERDLLVFARRYDCDELACIDLKSKDLERCVLIEGWQEDGFFIFQEYESSWAWVLDAIRESAEFLDRDAKGLEAWRSSGRGGQHADHPSLRSHGSEEIRFVGEDVGE